ncbi:hypothetical protein BZZ01_22585 [Nostocales cyanobacterium HT-58-2]|nr:hypothetical protein BZZ01_22585 [Nostocales cyanobacterium HT-58-2]
MYLVTLIRFFISYHRTQQALHWWSYRQSMKLFQEAEKIRDGLLQESFTIRRSLEMLPVDDVKLSVQKTQDCLKKIDNFHESLVQLSDRLFPAYLQDSLPLAIQCVLEPWRISHPHKHFHIDMPTCWRHESLGTSLTVVRTLEELLRITLPEALTPISIYISLEEQKNMGHLIVRITYPDISTLIFYSRLLELKLLCKTFTVLTSGKCSYRNKNLSLIWHLWW